MTDRPGFNTLAAADAALHLPVRTATATTGRLTLERGQPIPELDVGFRLLGEDGLPVVAVLGGISASRHVAACADDPTPGWWQQAVGRGRALDPERVQILSVDFLGGPHGTSVRGGGTLTSVHTRDQARMILLLMDELGIGRLHRVVGASYGGMVALAMAELFHARVDGAVVISAAHESHPMATAIRSAQRDLVRLGIKTGHEAEAVRIARALAITTYRTAAEFAERFAREPLEGSVPARFPVQEYLEHQGRKYVRTHSAAQFLLLSESCDLHFLAPEGILAPVTLIGADSDTMVPPWQLEELAGRLPRCEGLYMVSSIYGHDTFLKSEELLEIVGGAVSTTLSAP